MTLSCSSFIFYQSSPDTTLFVNSSDASVNVTTISGLPTNGTFRLLISHSGSVRLRCFLRIFLNSIEVIQSPLFLEVAPLSPTVFDPLSFLSFYIPVFMLLLLASSFTILLFIGMCLFWGAFLLVLTHFFFSRFSRSTPTSATCCNTRWRRILVDPPFVLHCMLRNFFCFAFASVHRCFCWVVFVVFVSLACFAPCFHHHILRTGFDSFLHWILADDCYAFGKALQVS